MWVAQEGGSGCVPAVGSAVRCLRVIWSGRRRAVGGALSFHNTHASPAQNTVIGFEALAQPRGSGPAATCKPPASHLQATCAATCAATCGHL